MTKLTVLFFFLFAAVCSSLFAGKYSDPNHPNCLRVVDSETKNSAKVFGADAASGQVTCDGKTDVNWGPLPATINGIEIIVDFSSKGGPSDITGKYDNEKIVWADGNAWVKLSNSSL